MRLLIVEDEQELAEIMQQNLHRDGIAADLASSAADAHLFLDTQTYDAILLDINLPDENGIHLLEALRQRKVMTPVIFVSANADVADRIRGLNSGADDYITKPFSHDELLARLRAVMRRPGHAASVELRYGSLRFNTVTREIFLNDEPFLLSKREQSLLELLMTRANRVVSKESIEGSLYDYSADIGSNAVEVLISRLRKHLTDNSADVTIHTVRGVGYILKDKRDG